MERLVFATLRGAASRPPLAHLHAAGLAGVLRLPGLDAAVPRRAEQPTRPLPHTAVIEIKGEIASGGEASAEFVVAAMRSRLRGRGRPGRRAADQLAGRQPGAGRHHQRRDLRRLKAKHKKPVYAVVEESCASAAYYIAAAADRIFVDKASIVGSIGVLMDGFGFTGLMDKLGVERRLMTAGENKGFLDPFSPQTERQREHRAGRCSTRSTSSSSTWCKTGRGKRLKEAPELFSGLFWTGQQAVELGLADQLGNLDFVAREVDQGRGTGGLHPPRERRRAAGQAFGASIGEGAVRALQRRCPALR